MSRLAFLLVPILLVAQAEGPPCDSALLGRARGGSFGYAPRGDRCEGLYSRQVAGGTVLYLVSLTEAFGDYDPRTADTLIVEWSGAGDGALRLRAEGVRPELYYRMDAGRPGSAGSFRWPTTVLVSQRIPRRDIGVVGWTTRSLGGSAREVYVPLRIAPRGRTAPCGTPRLALWPGRRLDSLTMSVASVSASGVQSAWIREDEELGEGYYPAQDTISVLLSGLAPGTYVVRFVAFPRGGAPTPVSYYIQRPPPAPGCTG